VETSESTTLDNQNEYNTEMDGSMQQNPADEVSAEDIDECMD
jgi:hypothetical protein